VKKGNVVKKIDKNIIAEIETIVGHNYVITDPEKMVDYSHDEFSLPEIAHVPEAVVKPSATSEVAEICRLANREKIPLTPRGGATGLCGGCVPWMGGLVVSLERMNRILELDLNNQMAVVEAGVTLMDFYSAVNEAGLYFPPHPGDESAVFGGLVATNAGGARAVKYGVIRNYIRGLEVALPSGKVIQTGGKLMKSSTGYNLLNLFIGSEGTLGIVTQATVQLMPPPPATRSLIIPYTSLRDAIATVPQLILSKILPLAVEFIPREVILITEKMLNKKWPCSQGNTYLLIILDAAGSDEMDRLSEKVAEVCLLQGALDVFVADSTQKQEQVLTIRSKIYESIKDLNVETLDIVVPRALIAELMEKVLEVQDKYGMWLPTYGHAADGNVHTHIMRARYENGNIIPLAEAEWKPKLDLIRQELYQDCKEKGGLISGEHGIGLVKKSYMTAVLDEAELELMRGIKKVFDPQNIMNPGKVFD